MSSGWTQMGHGAMEGATDLNPLSPFLTATVRKGR